MTIKCGRGNHAHLSAKDVFACYNGDPTVVSLPLSEPTETVTADEAPATDKQIKFFCSLVAQRIGNTAAGREMIAEAQGGRWGRRSISAEINALKAMPKLPAESTPGQPWTDIIDYAMGRDGQESDATAQTPVDLEAGMYRLGEDVYKVQVAVHGSGHPYAKKLTATEECRDCGEAAFSHKPPGGAEGRTIPEAEGHEFSPKWQFVYAAGAIKKLRPEHRMSLEEAKKFGKIYGVCCVCAAVLTNETSIEEGIGPVCGGRM